MKETELVEYGGSRRGSRFKAENPIFQPKSKSLFSGDYDKGQGDKEKEDKPKVRRPPGEVMENQSSLFRPPPSQRVQLSLMEGKGGNLGDEETARPPRPGTPPLPSQSPPAPSRKICKWRRTWDKGEQAHYFENEEGRLGASIGEGVLGGE